MRKGQTSGDLMSFLALFFFNLFILAISFIFIIPNLGGDATYRIEQTFSERADSPFISGYLTYSDGSELWDMMVQSYLKNDYADFSRASDTLLREVYGKETAWRLYVNDEKAAESCDAGCTGQQLDYASTLPLPYDPSIQALQIRLQVYP